jgi:hypothetical protein
MSAEYKPLTISDKAVLHLVKRLKADPRLAYLIGPGSESFEMLMSAGAAICSYDVAPYEQTFLIGLKIQPVPRIGDECTTVDAELLHRMSLLNDGVLDLDELVNHFIGLGLEAEEAKRDTMTEELF